MSSTMIDTIVSARAPRIFSNTVLFFAGTLFLSSLLMFVLEPMVAKLVLPRLGGAPMVWNTCLLFFQLTLLVGYAFAHGGMKALGIRRFSFLYLFLLLGACTTIPFAIRVDGSEAGIGHPVTWLFTALGGSIGLPFLLLSASASTLQAWFSRTSVRSANDPYFLYAASNAGSLGGLLLYPLVIERVLPLSTQTRVWTAGFWGFVALVVCCVWMVPKQTEMAVSISDQPDGPFAGPITGLRRLKWLVLALIPSSLLQGISTYLTTDLVSVPLLWVMPLSIYLLTFAVAFAPRTERWSRTAAKVLPFFAVALAVLMTPVLATPVPVLLPLHVGVFTLAAMMCHGQLAADRPSVRNMTEFYLWIAVGGSVGALFNVLIAPLIFDGPTEYWIVLVAACVLRPTAELEAHEDREGPVLGWIISLIAGMAGAAIVLAFNNFGLGKWLTAIGLIVPAMIALSQSAYRLRFAAALGSMLLMLSVVGFPYGHLLYKQRTFFGVYRVSMDASGKFHRLIHGTTLHGLQRFENGGQLEPLSYYSRTGPFGQIYSHLPPTEGVTHVAVVGLGSGALATYVRPQQELTFYEIDTALERIARNQAYFTFLSTCGDRCRVVIGDARIELALATQRYDLIVLDAFSSDTIPVHLLTREALSIYLSHLERGGIMAFHISSRHLELGPVLGRLAGSLGLTALEKKNFNLSPQQVAAGGSASDWLVVGRNSSELKPFQRDDWREPTVSASTPLWTDDFSDFVSVIRW